jgi:hypothetical protein
MTSSQNLIMGLLYNLRFLLLQWNLDPEHLP